MTAFGSKISRGLETIKYTDTYGRLKPYDGLELESVLDGQRLIGKLKADTVADIKAQATRAEYAGYKVESIKYEMSDGSTGYDGKGR
jgi:hypothetical protein